MYTELNRLELNQRVFFSDATDGDCADWIGPSRISPVLPGRHRNCMAGYGVAQFARTQELSAKTAPRYAVPSTGPRQTSAPVNCWLA